MFAHEFLFQMLSHDRASLIVVSIVYGVFYSACMFRTRNFFIFLFQSTRTEWNRAILKYGGTGHTIPKSSRRRVRTNLNSQTISMYLWLTYLTFHFRARIGVGLGIISLGLLGSAPAQGALLGNDHASFVWVKPIAYSGVSLLYLIESLVRVINLSLSSSFFFLFFFFVFCFLLFLFELQSLMVIATIMYGIVGMLIAKRKGTQRV